MTIRTDYAVGFDINSTKTSASINLATGGAVEDEANRYGKLFRYHSLALEVTIDGKSPTVEQLEKIKNIKLEMSRGALGDEVLRDFNNAKDIYYFNKSKGHTVNPRFIDLHFTNWLCDTEVEQGTTALGTADISKLVISARLETGHNLINPEIKLIRVFDYINEPIGAYTIVHNNVVNWSTAGNHYITHNDEDLRGKGLLNSVLLMDSKVKNLEVEINKRKIQEGSLEAINHINNYINKSTKTYNNSIYYHRDFTNDSVAGGLLLNYNVRECRFKYTTSGAINTSIYYEFLKGVDEVRGNLLNTLRR